jgi:hypothetical protein
MRDRHNDILDLSRRELMAYAGAAALTAGTVGSATLANAQAKTRFVFANESDYDTPIRTPRSTSAASPSGSISMTA